MVGDSAQACKTRETRLMHTRRGLYHRNTEYCSLVPVARRCCVAAAGACRQSSVAQETQMLQAPLEPVLPAPVPPSVRSCFSALPHLLVSGSAALQTTLRRGACTSRRRRPALGLRADHCSHTAAWNSFGSVSREWKKVKEEEKEEEEEEEEEVMFWRRLMLGRQPRVGVPRIHLQRSVGTLGGRWGDPDGTQLRDRRRRSPSECFPTERRLLLLLLLLVSEKGFDESRTPPLLR
ncbi:hypothetical protein FQN60_006014, partial [Etheostoma spectabile]